MSSALATFVTELTTVTDLATVTLLTTVTVIANNSNKATPSPTGDPLLFSSSPVSEEEQRLRFLWVSLGIFLGFCTVAVALRVLYHVRGRDRVELEEDPENRQRDIDAARARIQVLSQQHDADELEKRTQAATIAANQVTVQEQNSQLTRLTPLQIEVDELRLRHQCSQADLQAR